MIEQVIINLRDDVLPTVSGESKELVIDAIYKLKEAMRPRKIPPLPPYRDEAIGILRAIQAIPPYANNHCHFCGSAEIKRNHFDDCPYYLGEKLLTLLPRSEE